MFNPLIDIPEVFKALMKSGILQDDKAVADLTLKVTPSEINTIYDTEVRTGNMNLATLYHNYFESNIEVRETYSTDPTHDIVAHIDTLWTVLVREPNKIVEGYSSLIPLPHPYIVPGGRFNEIYYWDSYFTMLGLLYSGRIDMIEHMIDNFAYLINTYGFIPNGNRTYFLTRSQPPFFSFMVKLLADSQGEQIYNKYLPQLIKEYNWWMQGEQQVTPTAQANKHCVLVNGVVLNRYYDNASHAREEMFNTDTEMLKQHPEIDMRDVRAACESGWDFSSRWLRDPQQLQSIHTLDILPIDLNVLLWHLEYTIGRTIDLQGNAIMAQQYHKKARQRKEAVMMLMYDGQWIYDYDWKVGQRKKVKSLAAMYPLWMRWVEKWEVQPMVDTLVNEFLRPCGLISTIHRTNHQWDAPNGWAPLQYISTQALLKYGRRELAEEIADRWTLHCQKIFNSTGKMLEKYNVEDPESATGGGEYPVQDGFGWTNGVYLALKDL